MNILRLKEIFPESLNVFMQSSMLFVITFFRMTHQLLPLLHDLARGNPLN